MKIYSLQTLADSLGTKRRALQYFIDKKRPVPDRRIQQGKHSVRYFTEKDRHIMGTLFSCDSRRFRRFQRKIERSRTVLDHADEETKRRSVFNGTLLFGP